MKKHRLLTKTDYAFFTFLIESKMSLFYKTKYNFILNLNIFLIYFTIPFKIVSFSSFVHHLIFSQVIIF